MQRVPLCDHRSEENGAQPEGTVQTAQIRQGLKPTDATVLDFVNKGKGSMPAFASVLSDDEKQDLLAYLKTL